MEDIENIILEASIKIHEAWCLAEYRAFYERLMKCINEGNTFEISLKQACFEDGIRQNEVVLKRNIGVIKDFDSFIELIKEQSLVIRKYSSRSLTQEEIIKIESSNDPDNYKEDTKEENILRNFEQLSNDSQKETLRAALSAFEIFENFSKAGYTKEQLEKDDNVRRLIGIAIHTDWLERNIDCDDERLMIPYENLDSFSKKQDLVVFDAVLKVINKRKIEIPIQEGYILPDYHKEEQQVLSSLKNIY